MQYLLSQQELDDLRFDAIRIQSDKIKTALSELGTINKALMRKHGVVKGELPRDDEQQLDDAAAKFSDTLMRHIEAYNRDKGSPHLQF